MNKVGQRLPVLVGGLSLVLAVAGPWITPYDPQRPTADVLMSPSVSHPMGTDASGLDVFSVTVAAYRTDLLIALAAVALSLVVGIVLGVLAGYSFGGSRPLGILGKAVDRLLDLVQSIPVVILGLALVATFGRGMPSVIAAVAFVNVPVFARLLRSSLKSAERGGLVQACRSVGLSERATLLRHVLPNSLDSTLANASVALGGAILLTAALSFLGAGVRPPTPEWGALISGGANYVPTGQWWISVFPGLVLSLTVVCFALAGESVRDRLSAASGRKRSANAAQTDAAQTDTDTVMRLA